MGFKHLNRFFLRNFLLWFFFIFCAFLLVTFFFSRFKRKFHDFDRITYSQFVERIHNGIVTEIVIHKKFIDGITKTGELFSTYAPSKITLYHIEKEWIDRFGISVQAVPPKTESLILKIFVSCFPVILFVVLWILLIKYM